jgi:DNA-binding NarL/FixJ family response regulator
MEIAAPKIERAPISRLNWSVISYLRYGANNHDQVDKLIGIRSAGKEQTSNYNAQMTTSIPVIDQLINLATRIAQASLNGLGKTQDAATKQAIRAVCHHLRREGGYRSDITTLVDMCEATTDRNSEEDIKSDPSSALGDDATTILTARQKEILELLARGLSYKETARQLSLSTLTVKNHASAIYEKLNVKNKTEAIFEARATGILK